MANVNEMSDQQLADALLCRQKSIDDVKAKLDFLMTKNKIKKGSVKARTFEFAFLHGVMLVRGRNTYYEICISSGRSILDKQS